MRKQIVAGNWKMNKNLSEGQALVADVLAGMPLLSENKIVVLAPAFLNIPETAKQLSGVAHVFCGAQNVHHEMNGAYTGEVSPTMLQAAGAEYVLIGHSERREYNGEHDALLVKKMNAALSVGLKPIFCCGEALEIRDANQQNDFVAAQIQAGLFHLSAADISQVAIAYEPIWAIGTGRTASAAQAQEMHAHIRATVASHFGSEIANEMSILYGGSCKPGNAAEIFAGADVDGGLIGGAALKADEFLGIVSAMVAK
ncbi:MAG: triose-phosphate isomerase [Bacteroidetes bacterium]|nr:triose-phosphate isomerase [Bacteroidota bacterium]